MKKLFFLSLLLPCLFVLPDGRQAFGQDNQQELTLQQCIAMALNNNLDIETTRFGPLIQLEDAMAGYGPFDYTLFSNLTDSDSKLQQSSVLEGARTLEQDAFDASMGVRKKFPLGVETELKLSTNRFFTNSLYAVVNPRWRDSASLGLTLPIFKGFGTDVNSSQIIVAQKKYDVSVYDFEKSLQQTVFEIHKGYLELIYSYEHNKLTQEALDVAKRLLDENKKKFEAGLIPKVDVTQAEVQVAIREEELISSQKLTLNAQDQLKKLIDPSMLLAPQEISFIPLDKPEDVKEIDEKALLDESVKQAFEGRPDYLALKRQIEAQEVLIEKASNDLLPKVNIVGQATVNGINGTFPDAYTKAATGDYRDLSIGLVFEYPLENSSARHNRKKAGFEKRRLQGQLHSFENDLILQIKKAVREVKTQEKRIKSAREQVRLAKERYDAESSRLEQGLSTTFYVLDAQKELTSARVNELGILIDYNIAIQDLKRATATNLTQHGIKVKDQLNPRMNPVR